MRIGAARRIVVCQAINQRYARVATYYGGNINGFRVANLQCRNDFKLLQYRLDLGGVLGLRGTNHYVFTAFATPAALVKHLKGFAYSRGITQKHLELSTALTALLELDLREELLGARPR
jgi:hypothetical protein